MLHPTKKVLTRFFSFLSYDCIPINNHFLCRLRKWSYLYLSQRNYKIIFYNLPIWQFPTNKVVSRVTTSLEKIFSAEKVVCLDKNLKINVNSKYHWVLKHNRWQCYTINIICLVINIMMINTDYKNLLIVNNNFYYNIVNVLKIKNHYIKL